MDICRSGSHWRRLQAVVLHLQAQVSSLSPYLSPPDLSVFSPRSPPLRSGERAERDQEGERAERDRRGREQRDQG